MIVSWMTTNRCNLNCKHCYQDAGDPKSKELSTEEAKSMIDGIRRAGFKVMIFSGGEPLMRPDIFELVSYAREQGLRPVFGTNGTLLTRETVDRLKSAGASAMGISLDSLDPEKHNRFRGGEEAYQHTLQGMENCRRASLAFQIHVTVMDWNKEEILDIIDFGVKMGAMAVYVFFLIPVGRGRLMENHAVEVDAYEEILKKIMLKQKEVPITIKPTCAPQFMRVAQQLDVPVSKRFSRGCLAGLSYCIVSPIGQIRPCAYMTEIAGDVHTDQFDEVWANSSLFRKMRTKAYEGSCGSCAYGDVCGGCRARAAYYHDGNVLAEDPYCAYGRMRE